MLDLLFFLWNFMALLSSWHFYFMFCRDKKKIIAAKKIHYWWLHFVFLKNIIYQSCNYEQPSNLALSCLVYEMRRRSLTYYLPTNNVQRFFLKKINIGIPRLILRVLKLTTMQASSDHHISNHRTQTWDHKKSKPLNSKLLILDFLLDG